MANGPNLRLFSITLPGSAENRLDAGDKLPRFKGFGQVVVGTKLQSHNPVGKLAPGCQHDDRNGRGTTNDLEQFKTVHTRKHHIQNDEIRRLILELFEPLVRVSSTRTLEIIFCEVIGEKSVQLLIIIDN